MLQQGTVADQILDVVRSHPECTLEDIRLTLSGVASSEVFLEVDRLSRSGQLRLTQCGPDLRPHFPPYNVVVEPGIQ